MQSEEVLGGDEDWSDAITSQGMPSATQMLEEVGAQPCYHLAVRHIAFRTVRE